MMTKARFFSLLALAALAIAAFRMPFGHRAKPHQLIIPGVELGDLEEWMGSHPIAAMQNSRQDVVALTTQSTVYLWQIRDSETMHVHKAHDIMVTLLKGRGELIVEGKTTKVVAGDAYFIPAGKKHAFVNYGGGGNPALLSIGVTPPLVGGDTSVLWGL